jgi:hypothetical protein
MKTNNRAFAHIPVKRPPVICVAMPRKRAGNKQRALCAGNSGRGRSKPMQT